MANKAASDIVVVASCNIDLISYVPRIPKIGETLMGQRFQMGFGGKGANKAVACSRLGSKCAIISKFGEDIFGNDYIDYLKKSNINTENVLRTDLASTGVAPIIVDEDGRNSIIVVLGANLLLSSDDIKSREELIRTSKILVANLEIQFETVLTALKIAKNNNVTTILNFAPAITEYTRDVFDCIDYLILNEVEIEQLLRDSYYSFAFKEGCEEDIKRACNGLLEKHPALTCVIVTLGDKGVIYSDRLSGSKPVHMGCEKVKVVDSTGAGDAFVGAFAHYLNHCGKEAIDKAIRLAVDYASLTVQYPGTQTSYLSIDKLDAKFKI